MERFFRFLTKGTVVGFCVAAGYSASLFFWSPASGYGANGDTDKGTTEKKEETATPSPVKLISPPSAAASPKKETDEGPKPKVGLRASTMPSAGYGMKGLATATDADLSGTSLPGIGGSLSRSGKGWSIQVSNNAKVTYSVSVKVEQLSRDGHVVKSDSASYTLKAGEKAGREFNASSSSTGASLYLVSFRKVGSAQASAVPASE